MTCTKEDDQIQWDFGKRGETIARVREEVLQILESGNACSARFREADPGTRGRIQMTLCSAAV